MNRQFTKKDIQVKYKHMKRCSISLAIREIKVKTTVLKLLIRGFAGGAVVKNPPANAGDMGSSPGPGRSHVPRSN